MGDSARAALVQPAVVDLRRADAVKALAAQQAEQLGGQRVIEQLDDGVAVRAVALRYGGV